MKNIACLCFIVLSSIAPSASAADVAAPAGAAAPAPKPAYDPKNYIGVPVTDAAGKLQYVAENPSQTHSKDNYVTVRVKGITATKQNRGRVRIAVWKTPENFAIEGKEPFRASAHWAKDANNGEMIFRIGGLEKGQAYSFFFHYDKENRGFVKKNFLGIPFDDFGFSNKATQGKSKMLKRDGFSPPKFDNTLVTFTGPGQEIVFEI